MRAFVTGGSGFVGGSLIAALRRRGDEVRALARSDGARATVARLGAEPIPGDLDDTAAIAAGLTGCQVVYHSAAVVKDWGDPAEFERVNVEATDRLLSAARAAKVSRAVHISTEAVLVGGAPIHMANETWPLPSDPIGLYPQTKGEAERRVVEQNRDGLTTVIVRPRFIWGRGDTTLLPRISDMVRKKRFRWIDGGHYLTSTCHVENVVEGTLLAGEKGRGGERYFLTDGPPVEFREFLSDMLRTQGVEPPTGSVPHVLASVLADAGEILWRLFPLKGEPPLTRTGLRLIGEEVTVDDTKARKELGYKAHKTREQGLEELRAAG